MFLLHAAACLCLVLVRIDRIGYNQFDLLDILDLPVAWLIDLVAGFWPLYYPCFAIIVPIHASVALAICSTAGRLLLYIVIGGILHAGAAMAVLALARLDWRLPLLRRSTVVAAAGLLVPLLVARHLHESIWSDTLLQSFLWVAAVVFISSAFTRADRLRLCAGAVLLSSLIAGLIEGPTALVIDTARFSHIRTHVGTAISAFVQRHDRAPTSLRELYPDTHFPRFSRNDPCLPTDEGDYRTEGRSEPCAGEDAYRPGVLMKDPRAVRGVFWRYDPRTGLWSTQNPATLGQMWEAAMRGDSALFLLQPFALALAIVALSYRPWRRLGDAARGGRPTT